ncbi:hypothetical protein BP6252_02125 [Coleophoma cylindrospora]|uniref:Uncharacterized protein n=1 Tax=Coleophoma cylindrospora TaxID=1849047 RepID=A0A3D8SDX2_9HELO|nr:hypothetical protein BP6252_02125 [Coleophoma cylindrospora]
MAATPVTTATSGLTITLPSAPAAPVKFNQVSNKNGPDQKFQVTEQILYERDFAGEAYVSAHLQRLQNGLYDDDNVHTKNTIHVTFVAISFVLHPSLSVKHRFESAIVTLTARSEKNEQLRFLKYAPHAAYGRMSTESLKWNFQLGASVGVTKCPVGGASVNAGMSHEKDKVVGTMMKIQGSTRSTYHREGFSLNEHRKPDTKLVWSLEENSQQESGLPREFTFVFLVERPSTKKQKHLECEKPSDHKLLHLHHVQGDGAQSPGDQTPQQQSPTVAPHTPIPKLVDPLASTPQAILSPRLPAVTTPPASPDEDDPRKLDSDYDDVFCPIHFCITVTPKVSGTMSSATLDIQTLPEESVVHGEVGQKFPTGGIHGEHADHCIDGMYNFAKLPGNFEDLMELPGNAITSVEPTLPEPK